MTGGKCNSGSYQIECEECEFQDEAPDDREALIIAWEHHQETGHNIDYTDGKTDGGIRTDGRQSTSITGRTRVLKCDYCWVERHALRDDGTAECGTCGRVRDGPELHPDSSQEGQR